MKDWIKLHYKQVIAVVLSIAYYIILFRICIDYIDFGVGRYNLEKNIAVAKFYFIVLPIAASLPVVIYEIVKYIKRK